MSKYQSETKYVNYPVAQVYAKLSDLENVEQVKDRLPGEYAEKVECDHDHLTFQVPNFGAFTLEVVEREPTKCIKLQGKNTPVPFTAWIQTLPYPTDQPEAPQSKLRVTFEVDIPIFLRPMVGGKIEEAVQQIANMLAALPYD